jgi:hypothetical protein
MRSFAVLVLALVVTGSAPADHLDPQKRIRADDQARARAMLLRDSDLPGFKRQPASGGEVHLTCSALDESDLTVTGDAEAPTWSSSVLAMTSSSTLYATRADAAASWTRGTSSAGTRCLRQELAREFSRRGARLSSSLRRLAFPALAQRSAAYRLTLTGESQGQTPTLFIDFVVLGYGRALTALLVATAFVQPDVEAEALLARRLAARMAKTMRGA